MAVNLRHLTLQESEPFFWTRIVGDYLASFPDASPFSRAPSLTLSSRHQDRSSARSSELGGRALRRAIKGKSLGSSRCLARRFQEGFLFCGCGNPLMRVSPLFFHRRLEG